MRRELLGYLKPLLEAQGIQFPDIGGVMSEEEHRNSLASTAGGGRPLGELQVPASGSMECHEHPLPSLEPNMIDNLAQPIACNLMLLVIASFRKEIERGLVYPR
jgi:hypothetical protein